MIRLLALLLLATAGPALCQNALRVDLGGSWRAIDEDNPAFADPAFDDTRWRTLVLPSRRSAELERYSITRRWLRRSVQLPAGSFHNPLSLTLGTFADVYEVWINGKRIGASGDLDSFSEAHIPGPLTFDIPAEVIPPSGELLIALRLRWVFWAPPVFDIADQGPYLITLRRDAPLHTAAEQMTIWREIHSFNLMFGTAFLLIALLSLVAWRSEPERREIGWFGLTSLVYAFNAIYNNLIITPYSQPYNRVGVAVLSAIAGCSMYPLFVQFVATALSFRSRWVYAAIWAGWLVLPLTILFDWQIRLGGNSANFFIACLAIVLVLQSWRRIPRSREAVPDHLFHFVLLLQAIGYFELWSRYLTDLLVFQEWFYVGPYRVWREDLLWLPVSVTILVLLIRRIAVERREKQRLADELTAARTVQQLLFPPLPDGSPIEAVYQPALEVGGDFYQVFPLDSGAHLVAVGDVSGKGLKAAMIVSLLAGVLRNRRSDAPGAILGELNRALCAGLDGGFVTAAVALCGADGSVSIASAGHPPPYLSGDEVPIEGGLPLGIDPEAQYAEQLLAIPEGQCLTFVSDGVVEAANTSGELFGFDHTREISTRSAAEIAAAAKAWGQNDDITVVKIRRQPA
ncbi:MAG: serine/threonine-protein phosphatase [Acidobacteria bacterium]|nr:serine/threonine-protein phosphatase [Acidobacteriota bacterium]